MPFGKVVGQEGRMLQHIIGSAVGAAIDGDAFSPDGIGPDARETAETVLAALASANR